MFLFTNEQRSNVVDKKKKAKKKKTVHKIKIFKPGCMSMPHQLVVQSEEK